MESICTYGGRQERFETGEDSSFTLAVMRSVESIGITRSDRADLLIPSADELYPTNPDLLVFVPSDNEVAFGRRQIKVIIYD